MQSSGTEAPGPPLGEGVDAARISVTGDITKLHCITSLAEKAVYVKLSSPTFQIDPKYVKKIESVVRHGGRDGPEAAPSAPCPQCGAALGVHELACARCEAIVPFCLASVSPPAPLPCM